MKQFLSKTINAFNSEFLCLTGLYPIAKMLLFHTQGWQPFASEIDHQQAISHTHPIEQMNNE